MGTDIHGWVEIKADLKSEWVKVDEVLDDRNYAVFDVLANGRGAGYIKPFAEARGLPEDYAGRLECTDDCHHVDGPEGYHYPLDWWIEHGHSHSWWDLRELAAHPGWDQEFTETKVVDRQTYLKWVLDGRKGIPYPHSGWVSGWGVIEANEATDDWPWGWNYVRTSWKVSCRVPCERWIAWMSGVLDRHKDAAEIRIVFGFDS